MMGTLSYYMNDEETEVEKPSTSFTKVEVLPNGPLLVHGDISVILADGNQEERESPTAFCRCGGSKNKPYCDGTHTKIDFKD